MKNTLTIGSVLVMSLFLSACGAESKDDNAAESMTATPEAGSASGGASGSSGASGSGSSGSGGGATLPSITVTPPDCTTNCDFVGLLSDTGKHTPPGASNPALHSAYVDATFGTTIHRVTANSQISGVSRVRHYYSKQNPFNADGSYAMFVASNGTYWVYDAATFEPILNASEYPHVSSSEPEIQWHPTNPDQFYYLEGTEFSRFEISSITTTVLHDFADEGFSSVAGRLEGNMDKSGRYYAMIGESGSNSHAFVYDVQNDQLSQRININDIEDEGIDWISISQNGNFVVIMGHDYSYVYDHNMNYKGRLPEGSYGHADLCSLANGREVMVYDGADHVVASDGDRWINMAYLDTVTGDGGGTVDPLIKIGWSTTPHVSCRNTEFPGWALISTQGNGSNNYDKEIFWAKLDGSGEVRRVAHHYSNRESGGYFAEQHAVTNKHGTKIIFASNYGSGAISSYLIDLTDFRRPLAE